MKTKELTELLKKEDPTGEIDVVVGNIPITDVAKEPAYWDGSKHEIIRDTNGKLEEYKITDLGYKISLDTVSLDDILLSDIDIFINLNELSTFSKKRWEEHIAKELAENKQINEEVDKMMNNVQDGENDKNSIG